MEAETALRARAGKYLTFLIGEETYAIEVARVREIIGVVPVTAVPRVPPFVKGVINLRGKILPVVDLRMRFGLAPRENTRETCIVIVDIQGLNERLWIGVVVDSVCDVLDVGQSDIEAVPDFGQDVDTSFLLGMSRSRETVKLLLDIECLLNKDEVTVLEVGPEQESAAQTPEETAPDGEGPFSESPEALESLQPTEPGGQGEES